MSSLFTPVSFGPLTLENRIVIAPMCQYSAHDGLAQDWHLMHYGGLSLSGAGLLILEATAVEPCGRISAGDLGLWDDATEAGLARVLAAIRAHSPMPLSVQLAHAGRKASCAVPWKGGSFIPPAAGGWLPCAPSALAYAPGDLAPQMLDAAGIRRVRAAFAASARRAARLGLDAVELHSAHGYLLHEFLSPLTNLRGDEYGGSLDNRLRLTLEVFAAMREALPPAVPLGVRISASDWAPGGWSVEESAELTRRLKGLGAAYIHVSSGGLTPEQKISVGPGYQLPFAARIRAEAGLATIAVGLITEPEQAEAVIASGQADAVALGRAMLYDPRWPWHAAARLGAQAACPPQHLRCQPYGFKELLRPGGRR